MTRKAAAAVIASLGAVAAGTAARLLPAWAEEVVLGFEGVLDDDWGVPGDHPLAA